MNAPEPARIRPGVLLLALLLQTGILFWVVRSEITARVFVSSWTVSMPGMLLLLALVWANARRGGRAFSRAELLVCYVAVSGTVTLAGYNFFQLLAPTLGSARYLASTYRWGQLLPFYPDWLVPRDPAALRRLFSGESSVP